MVLMLSLIIGIGFWIGVKLYEKSVFKAFQTTVKINVQNFAELFTPSDRLLTQINNHYSSSQWNDIKTIIDPYKGQRLVLFDQDMNFITANHSRKFTAKMKEKLGAYEVSFTFMTSDGSQEIKQSNHLQPHKLVSESGEFYGYLVLLPVQDILIHPESFTNQVTSNVLWLLFMLLVTILAVVTLFLKYILKPVKALRVASMKLKQGITPDPVSSNGTGEIAELIDVFNSAVKEMNQSAKIRKEFIADIAHEFKTPIANLNGKFEAAQKNIIPFDQAMLKTLTQEVSRLEVLVNDLQQLAVADSGELLLQKQDTYIFELIENTIGLCNWQSEVKWVNNIEKNCVLNVDPYRLQQVFLNLFENAYKYAGPNTTITVQHNTAKEPHIIQVKDSGSGIPKSDIEQIFKRFYRADIHRTSHSTGTGLGLSICQSIIHAHSGSIQATNASPSGLIITIQLPQS